ncbi:amino acid permease [Alkalihalophilus lindianensis]|uniref:Amino acid permease n=1 Tax=Alkalihalophilus lindianensis TaxID=1630542 RepID=A0ABU3X963_9BACI|nr:amino acid permease [Alkalihalophilus lindianensis]MDV2684430.1 amino acid permease [Alkalihalophilus lindianensis]
MQNQKPELNKVLSRLDVFVLSVGAMLGWGWVVLSEAWLTSAGSLGTVLAFIIGGLLVTFVGLTYAELASAMPKVGGEHVYVHRAMGNKAAFIASWAITLGYVSVVAFEAVALPTVIEYIFPNYQVGYMWTIAGWDVYASWVLVGVGGSIFVMAINYFGLKPAAKIQVILTASVILMGLMLIFGSAFNGNSSNFEPLFINGATGIMAVLIMVPFLFIGFDVIPQTAEEANVPPRDIGKLLIFSVVCAIVFYILIAIGVASALDGAALSTTQLATADAMTTLFGSAIFGKLLIVGGVAGILTSWNAFIIGGSRVIFAMAQSDMLPKWFAKLHPKYKTPSNAILFIGALAVVSPLLGRPALVWFVNSGGPAIVIAYLMVAIAFILLRKREPEMERPYKSGKTPIVGWIATIFSIGFLIIYLPGMPAALIGPEWAIFGGWFLIGFYYFVQMSRGKYKQIVNEDKSDKKMSM